MNRQLHTLQTFLHRGAGQRIAAVMAMLALTVAAVAVGPGAASASALGSNCRHYPTDTVLPVGGYFASPVHTVPKASLSGCNDINLEFLNNKGVPSSATDIRIRFYLKDGTTRVYRGFHTVEVGTPAATDVQNGATYRIETRTPFTKIGIFD